MRLIEGKPEYLGLILRHFIDRSFGQQDRGFRYNECCQLYDPTAILGRLERYGERAIRTSEERRAADLFRQRYLDSRHTQPDTEV